MMDRAALNRLIPHAGGMCLLETVEAWTGEWIRCRTACHRWEQNPLRRNGRLESVHALEIGGQAVALHGSLANSEEVGDPQAPKYLGGIRDLTLIPEPLETIPEDLVVTATCLGSQGGSGVYRLMVSGGAREILSAQITVMGYRGDPS